MSIQTKELHIDKYKIKFTGVKVSNGEFNESLLAVPQQKVVG